MTIAGSRVAARECISLLSPSRTRHDRADEGLENHGRLIETTRARRSGCRNLHAPVCTVHSVYHRATTNGWTMMDHYPLEHA